MNEEEKTPSTGNLKSAKPEKRIDRRELERADRAFQDIFNPLIPEVGALSLNLRTGKLDIPIELNLSVDAANIKWNNLATILNRRLKGVKANYGAVKENFRLMVAKREAELYYGAVKSILKQKYGIENTIEFDGKKVEVDGDFFDKQKEQGKFPELAVDLYILTMKPLKVSPFRHIHNRVAVYDGLHYHIVCKDCWRQEGDLYTMRSWAEGRASELPKTNFGMKFVALRKNHFPK